jgi:uncharacterized protein
VRRIFLAVASVALITAGCHRGQSGLPAVVVTFHTAERNVTVADYRLADTQPEREQGLMGVTSLGRYGGEVFLFEGPQTSGGFWMKDTLIPLSIAFWGPDGRIYKMFDMQPCTADPCHVYNPGGTFVGAIEMGQGGFDRLDVKIGDTVEVKVNDG